MQRFEIALRIGLVLFVTVGKQLVLPRNHILGGDLVDLALAEVRDDLGLDDMLLGLPSAFFQPCFEIGGVNLHKGFKAHIQVPGALLLELLFPFQSFTAGIKPSLAFLLSCACPVSVLCDHIPFSAFFVLISRHFLRSFLFHKIFH